MNSQPNKVLHNWHLDPYCDPQVQITSFLESLQAAGLLRASACAVLLGEQYHLGGEEDTRRMAKALGITSSDRVLDLACYVGGPARQLAREYSCQVMGVDISEDCIAIARQLTQLCGLSNKVQFICCSADAVPLPDESFTVAWSQGSFPSDLSWLSEIHRLLVPGGRVGFTGLIRSCRAGMSEVRLRANACPPKTDQVARNDNSGGHTAEQHGGYARPTEPSSLDEIAARVCDFGFRVLSAEDISEMDLEYGWLPTRKKLEDNETHYRELMGEAWVRQAYADLDIDTESWRSGREGNGRIIAVKE